MRSARIEATASAPASKQRGATIASIPPSAMSCIAPGGAAWGVVCVCAFSPVAVPPIAPAWTIDPASLCAPSTAVARSIAPVAQQLSSSLYFTDPDGTPFAITSNAYEALASKLTEQAARDER